MGGDHPSERRRDDEVGTPGAPAAGGGAHTAAQAAITDMGPAPKSDAERKAEWSRSGEPGRDPPNPGGASGGHANQKSPRSGETVVSGQSKSEREQRDRDEG